ncbi:hypothetical protein Q644_09500 [Brucella intermedia 229E]|uniref:Uncharacterized protein n=2 Tax=Brucella intermedia TaxID=94625 RepID=U4V3R2_9HYPH|nr:hypothetical protein Q644_09500 [Brucella intermedia 229E]
MSDIFGAAFSEAAPISFRPLYKERNRLHKASQQGEFCHYFTASF